MCACVDIAIAVGERSVVVVHVGFRAASFATVGVEGAPVVARDSWLTVLIYDRHCTRTVAATAKQL